MKNRFRDSRLILAVPIIALIASCGGSQDNPAPEGSTITLSPPSVSWTITPNFGCGTMTHYHDQPFLITVKDSGGQPLNNIDIDISLDLSSDTTSHNWLVLYYDANGDGNVDAGEQVSNTWRTSTDWSGSKEVTVRADADCAFRGSLHVFSGSTYGSATIEYAP